MSDFLSLRTLKRNNGIIRITEKVFSSIEKINLILPF